MMMLGVDFSAFSVLVSTIMQLTIVPVEVDSPHMEDVFCVALNAYHEARGEDFNELLAVSQVVMNRVDAHDYPDTACDVVTQGPTRPSWNDPDVLVPRRHRCQFSWWCDGRSEWNVVRVWWWWPTMRGRLASCSPVWRSSWSHRGLSCKRSNPISHSS